MSALDDKLKAWREATDLEPSPELLAKLQAQTAPSASAVLTPVKVLLGVVAVGVVATVALSVWRPLATFDAAPLPVDAGLTQPAVVAVAPALADAATPCPPRSESPSALMAFPQPAGDLRAAEQHLAKRPLTCVGQSHPISVLLAGRANTPAERHRLWARQAFLCDEKPWGEVEDAPCDDADWCHVPSCDREATDCLEALAARRAGSCAAVEGKRGLVRVLCRQLVRGEASLRARITALQPTAWCLDDAVKSEVEWLRARGAVPGTP